jgi:hypothetical protein
MSEAPSCMFQKIRKARIDHKCCECFCVIHKGKNYLYTSGVWGGAGQSFKQCVDCHEIMMAAVSISESEDERPCFGMLVDWFFGYMCSSFKGEEFLNVMARDCGLEPAKLNRLLKIDLNDG